MPGSLDCAPSTSRSMMLPVRRASDSEDSAKDELRTLIVLVTDNNQLTPGLLLYVTRLQPSVSVAVLAYS